MRIKTRISQLVPTDSVKKENPQQLLLDVKPVHNPVIVGIGVLKNEWDLLTLTESCLTIPQNQFNKMAD